jgi:hypothetical protein
LFPASTRIRVEIFKAWASVGVEVGVAVDVGVAVAVGAGVAVAVAVDVGAAVAVGVAVGGGVVVALGVEVAVAVAVAMDVAVGDAVDVAVAVGVALGVAVGGTVGVGLGVGVTVGVGVEEEIVYVMFNLGGLVPLSRLRNCAALAPLISSPIMIHPKLVAGLETHACTSATIPLPLQVKVPRPGTLVVALTVGEKSPPGVVQKLVL